MKEQVEDKVIYYYYDSHPTEEDLMGETDFHYDLINYLAQVLRWLFREHLCSIHKNLNFYQTDDSGERPLVPDLAVIKGIPRRRMRSRRINRSNPAPQVVFEALSTETWKKDLAEKPVRYTLMGVQEYFAYDPHEPPLASGTTQRLFGWRRDERTGQLSPLRMRRDGRLWSVQLDSWLVPDGVFLRLYDREGNLRLTEAEAMAQQAEAEAEARAEADRRAQAEAERRAQAADRRAQALAEKLRSLGHDPDQL